MFQGTTIVAVKKGSVSAMVGDGQITLNQNTIMKHGARKIRRIYHDQVLVGFAGSVADAVTLFNKFEGKLEEFRGNLSRAAVEVAREWSGDKILRRLEALLVVMNKDEMFLLSGSGEVIGPDDNVLAIGSGGPYALAAARALLKHTDLDAREIAVEALKIAADICVFTNHNITVEEIRA
ncbi:MAG: ATP-dependent protease subunit HslV [Syntrophomonadaceae bacterium]|nr:ATP-dependent protease subunit HslV [Syntrophomonadaceae bacterium]